MKNTKRVSQPVKIKITGGHQRPSAGNGNRDPESSYNWLVISLTFFVVILWASNIVAAANALR